jgi:hypothetical protein
MKSCLIVDDSRVPRSLTRAAVENLNFDGVSSKLEQIEVM